MLEDIFDRHTNITAHRNVKSELIYGTISANKPLISVVIPTYKRAKYLKEAILSVINQEFELEYEIVIVDNNPIRNCETEILIKSLGYDNILYYKNDTNIGMTGNWNRCYQLANGKWVSMLHDDDIFLKNYFYEVNKYLDKDYPVITISLIKWYEYKTNKPIINTKSHRYSKVFMYKPYDFLFGYPIGPPIGTIINKDFFFFIGGYSDDYYPSIDYAFMVKASYYGKLIKLDKKLAIYRYSVNETLNPNILIKFLESDIRIKKSILNKYNIKGIIKRIFLYEFNKYALNYIDDYENNFNHDSSSLKKIFHNHKNYPKPAMLFVLLYNYFRY